MRQLYTLLLVLMTPFLVLRLLWKSRRLSAYRQRIGERFSLGCSATNPVDVWVHAVSLGEVMAATPIIQALLDKKLRVMVTTMTPTGSQQVISRFGRQVSHQYVPYDLPWLVRRFFKAIQPRLGLIMETELWPNLIDQANRLQIPLMLVNARLSDRAYKQYLNVSFVFKPVLNQLMIILAQSGVDASRFITLGASPACVQVGGNIKFDMATVAVEQGQSPFKHAWGMERVVVIVASTHDDEEQQILSCWRQLQQVIPDVLLLIAPRHPERFSEVFQLSQHQGFHTGLRSQADSISEQVDVIVLDCLGELNRFYALSDYAFVGGSLVPIGGHNVLEPIVAGVPVLCGPYMNNLQAICDDLRQAQAITQVANAHELVQAIIQLHQSAEYRNAQLQSARQVLKNNQGALSRCMFYVNQVMAASGSNASMTISNTLPRS